jgi:hypothetical protein
MRQAVCGDSVNGDRLGAGAAPADGPVAAQLPKLPLAALALAGLAVPVVAALLLPGEERVLLLSVVMFVAGGLGLVAHLALLVLRAAGVRLLGVSVGPMVVQWNHDTADNIVR